MAIFPFVFVRGNEISKQTLNHEKIHFEQQKELLLIGFYLLYFIFWIFKGYKNNPFEIEADQNEKDLKYIDKRKKFSWATH